MSSLQYLERQILPPTQRAEAQESSALRSIRRSHGDWKYRHLKAPAALEYLDEEAIAKMAFRNAEGLGGSPEEIESNARKNYKFLLKQKKLRSAGQGRATIEAVQKGAAEIPSTTTPIEQQTKAIQSGKTWYRTIEQAKIKLVKDGAIPPEEVRRFMTGSYTPETRKKLDIELTTPQVGPPSKFEGEETSIPGKIAGGLLDVLTAPGRGAAGYRATAFRDARESGALAQMARGSRSPHHYFISPVETVVGGAKAAFKMEGAPNLEAEIIKNQEYLMGLAFDEAEKELPKEYFSQEEVDKKAKAIYERYKDNLGSVNKYALENPSKAALGYEIAADPTMYVGGAPLRMGAKALGKVIPKAVKTGAAKAVAKGLGPVSYRAQFLPLEASGPEGKKLAEGLRFAETNLGPGAENRINRLAEKGGELFRRVKKEDRKLFYDVVHKKKPIEALPNYLQGIVSKAKSFSDEVFDIKVQAGTAQTLVKPRAKQYKELAGAGKVGDKLANELMYAESNIGKEAFSELLSNWTLVRNFAKENKLSKKKFKVLLNYARGARKTLPKKLKDNIKISSFANKIKSNVENVRDKYQIPEVGAGEIVQEASYLKDYGSPQLLQEAGFGTGAQRKYFGPITGAAKHRTGKGYPVEDVGKQWGHLLEAESKTAARAAAYSGIKEATDDIGAWTVYNPTTKQTTKETAEWVAEEFTQDTGNAIKFVGLDKELSRKVLQVTERPGALIKKDAQIILPEASANAIKRVAKIYDPEQSTKAFGELYDSTIKPMQNVWRINHTVLRSPQFLATNFVGAVGLGLLAHGLKALNPRLQRDAIRTAALAAFGGSSKALKTKYKLASGETKTLGELYDLMRDIGILGQYNKRYALDMPGAGILGKVEQAYRKIPQKVGLQQLAAFGDEYQHAVVFLGALKGTSPEAIAKAADFTAKFAGNFNRLTKVERTYLKEIAGFYSWNRFILPHVAQQIFENPQRLAVWEDLKRGWEEYYGANRPVFESGVQEWMKLQTMATAPESMQPDNPHEVAMIGLETPQNTFGALAGEGAIPFMLGPGASAAIELMTGIDLKTGKIKSEIGPYVPSFIEAEEGMINLAEKSLPFGEAMSNLGKLYWDWGHHGAAAETWLKYRAARDSLNIDRLATGQKFLGIPVLTKTYVFQPTRVTAQKKRRALGR